MLEFDIKNWENSHSVSRRQTARTDDNKKYLSTDLNKPIDLNSEFISNKIELLEYEFVYSDSWSIKW